MTSKTDQLANALKPAIASAVTRALDTAPDPVALDARDVVAQTAQAAAATVVNQTNNEPWYQSRVTWGAIIGGLVAIGGIWGYVLPPEKQSAIVEALVAIGSVIAPLLTYYGRWVATKPLPIGPST